MEFPLKYYGVTQILYVVRDAIDGIKYRVYRFVPLGALAYSIDLVILRRELQPKRD